VRGEFKTLGLPECSRVRGQTVKSLLRGRTLSEGAFIIGTSKRYAEQIDRRMSEQVVETIMRGEPFSLTEDELELDVQPITRTPVAVSAVAWVRYGAVAIKIPVEVVAWTSRAVANWLEEPRWRDTQSMGLGLCGRARASSTAESARIADR
jgi:hypothetical protein